MAYHPCKRSLPPGAGMAALLRGKGSISVVGVFSGIPQQNPLGDMEHPLVLDLTSVRTTLTDVLHVPFA